MFDPDVYFNEKLQEYYKQYLDEIISRLENSRIKGLTLEEIREENEGLRFKLYKFAHNEEELTDYFRCHIIEKFNETFLKNKGLPAKKFIEDVLPNIRLEDEAHFNSYNGTNSSPRYDIHFLKNSSLQEIIDLSAKSLLLDQAWWQISDFLCELYVDDEYDLGRILYSEYDDLTPSSFQKQILKEFPDLRNELKRCVKMSPKKTMLSKDVEPFILNVSFENEEKYIKRLHKLLKEKALIDDELTEFKKHFRYGDFSKTKWNDKNITLAYLISGLRFKNTNIHKITVLRFVNKNGEDFKPNLSQTLSKSTKTYPMIDNIVNEMKKLK